MKESSDNNICGTYASELKLSLKLLNNVVTLEKSSPRHLQN